MPPDVGLITYSSVFSRLQLQNLSEMSTSPSEALLMHNAYQYCGGVTITLYTCF
jgi:hypothetical protein